MSTPIHIGFIVDGNRRWARARGLPTFEGHRRGLERVKEVARLLAARGIPWGTFYLFSRENWNRSKEEVSYLLQLFEDALLREVDAFVRDGIRLRFVGDRSAFAPKLQTLMGEAEERSAACIRATMVGALNYGGQQEIVEAVQRLARAGGDCAQLSAAQLKAALSTRDLPPADLIIRTSGEQRLSNFLLWECAYAELYFTTTHFPDFDAGELDRALEWFAGRERRFGC